MAKHRRRRVSKLHARLRFEQLEARLLLSTSQNDLPIAITSADASDPAMSIASDATPAGSPAVQLAVGTWTAVGPAAISNGVGTGNPTSGRMTGLAASPTDPNTIYVATSGGGVWKTTDGGTTWTPLTDNQATLTMGAIALAPSNPNVIYAGTGEANQSGDSYYGLGVLKSTDGGNTWALLGSTQFYRHTIAPTPQSQCGARQD